jgi:hypothetical protein
MADVELRAIDVAGGVRQRKVAALRVAHDDLQMLTGLERRPRPDRETLSQDRDIGRKPYKPVDLRRDGLAAEDVDPFEPLRADGHVGAGAGAAHQRRAIVGGPPPAGPR